MLAGFVIMGLDKNPGKTTIICPVKMYYILESVYILDTTYYTRLDSQFSPQVVDAWRKAYVVYGWTAITKNDQFFMLLQSQNTKIFQDIGP
jgi:hypothetical protein